MDSRDALSTAKDFGTAFDFSCPSGNDIGMSRASSEGTEQVIDEWETKFMLDFIPTSPTKDAR